MKINSYQHNYMARRGHLFGVIMANPKRLIHAFTDRDGGYCSVGYALHVHGATDAELDNMHRDEGITQLANIYNLKERTIHRLIQLNDATTDDAKALQAMRKYLLNKSWGKAVKHTV